MLLADMQHSQPHMHLSQEVIFLSWGGIILYKVESLIMILLSLWLASLSSSYSGRITRLLWSYHTYVWNKNFGYIFCFLYHQWIRKDHYLILKISQPEGGVKSNCKGVLLPVDSFLYGHGYLKFFTTRYCLIWFLWILI